MTLTTLARNLAHAFRDAVSRNANRRTVCPICGCKEHE